MYVVHLPMYIPYLLFSTHVANPALRHWIEEPAAPREAVGAAAVERPHEHFLWPWLVNLETNQI